MNDASGLHAVIVIGDPESRVGRFVEKNLRAANVAAHFVDSTERFFRIASEVDDSRLILTEPDWELMLTTDCPGARIFVVKWRGSNWSPPWESAEFEVRDPYVDDRLFQRHVLAWLREG